eukprot:sb/3468229/
MSIWKEKPYLGYTVLGSNGEFQYLSLAEKCKMVETVREEDTEKIIIGGAGAESTKLTIECVSEIAKAGATTALIYTPCFYKGSMSGAAFKEHFTRVADASPIPVILYNVPGNTGLDMPVPVIADLASHENIIGVKESGGSVVRIGQIAHLTSGKDFQILAGSASFMKASYSVGAVGAVAALANVMGDEVCRLHDQLVSGVDGSLELQYRLIAPNTAVTAQFGIAGLKFVCDAVGLYGGPCRSPIQPLSGEQKGALSKIMSQVGITCQ